LLLLGVLKNPKIEVTPLTPTATIPVRKGESPTMKRQQILAHIREEMGAHLQGQA